MANASEETLLRSLNAAAVVTGSALMSVTAASLASSASSPLNSGGITLTNADATIQLWYSTTATAVVHGATSAPIPPGQQVFIPGGDLHAISVIAESGTPYIGWQAVRLS